MSDRNKRIAFGALLYLALCTLVLVAPRLALQQPSEQSSISIASRERIGINSKDDCWLYNGADLIAYSDDHSTAKVYIMGDSGNVGIGGNLVVTGSLTAAAGGGAVGVWTLNATDNVTVGGGLDIVGALEVTGTSTFHGAHSWDSYLSAGNGILAAGNLTGTGSAGNLRYASGMFTTTLSSNSISVTTGITGATLALSGSGTVTGLLTAGNGIAAAGGISTSGSILDNSGSASITINTATITSTESVGGLLTASNGVLVRSGISMTGSILDESGSGSITMNSGTYSSTLAANTLNTTDAITAGSTLRSVGAAYLQSASVTDTLGVAGVGTFSSELYADNGFRVTGPITQVSGGAILSSAYVTGTLEVAGVTTLSGGYTWTGEGSASNGLNVTGNITQTGSGYNALFGNTVVSGTADLRGVVSSDGGNMLRLNENTVVTGTLTASGAGTFNDTLGVAGVSTFSSEVDADNGLRVTGGITQVSGSAILNSLAVTSTATANTFSATNNITVTNDLTVTGFVGMGGTYFAVSSTVDYTDSQTIIVVADKTIYPVTAGGPTATLDAAASISDGFYLGQIIMICNVDTVATHLLVIKDSANTVLGGDLTLDADGSVSAIAAWFWWDGANWRYMLM